MRQISHSDYESYKKIWINQFGYPIYRVKNFVAYKDQGQFNDNPAVEKYVYINNKAFIIDVIGYSHFHFIHDKIAQYEFLKYYIPDLELYIVSSFNYIDKPDSIVEQLKYLYKIPNANIFNIDNNEHLIFKDLYFIWSTHNDVLTGTFHREYFDPWGDREDFKFYTKTIYPLLQKRFANHIGNPIPGNKIYISRFKQHESIGRDPKAERFISKEDEIKLENFLANAGYKIITAEDHLLLDQVKLYSEASHIMALKSSALVNTIFCSNTTNIVGINLDDEYQVWYDYICQDAGLKYTEVPQMTRNGELSMSYCIYKDIHNKTSYPIDDIINQLKENIAFS